MSVHSMQRKRRRDPAKLRYKSMGSHDEFLSRISKSLYYGNLPETERFSLPVSELAAELFSEVKSGRSLDRLHLEEAAEMSRNACVSPASLVLAMLYLERLKISSPEFVNKVSSSQLFLVSSLVANKFLQDDGEEDEVFNSEWAASTDIPLIQLNKLEKEFLAAIKWELYVEAGEFWKRLEWLEEEVALRQGSRRGWFSYTDLSSLLHSVDSFALAHTLLSVGAVCLTAYAAGVVSMVGSTVLVSSICRPNLYSSTTSLSVSRHSNDSDQSVCTPQEELEESIADVEDRLTGCTLTESDLSRLEEENCSSCNNLGHIKPNGSAPYFMLSDNASQQIRWQRDCDSNETNVYERYSDFLLSYSLQEYLLGTVARPLYSYIHLVASH